MPEKVSPMAKDGPGAPGVDARTLGLLPRSRFPSLDADCAPSTASLLVSYHSFLFILCTPAALEKLFDRCFPCYTSQPCVFVQLSDWSAANESLHLVLFLTAHDRHPLP